MEIGSPKDVPGYEEALCDHLEDPSKPHPNAIFFEQVDIKDEFKEGF